MPNRLLQDDEDNAKPSLCLSDRAPWLYSPNDTLIASRSVIADRGRRACSRLGAPIARRHKGLRLRINELGWDVDFKHTHPLLPHFLVYLRLDGKARARLIARMV